MTAAQDYAIFFGFCIGAYSGVKLGVAWDPPIRIRLALYGLPVLYFWTEGPIQGDRFECLIGGMMVGALLGCAFGHPPKT